jgi:hypothetical protein
VNLREPDRGWNAWAARKPNLGSPFDSDHPDYREKLVETRRISAE